MSFDQDPNESAQISGSGFAQMCDEMKRLQTELDAVTAERDELLRRVAERGVIYDYNKIKAERDSLKAACDLNDAGWIARESELLAENLALRKKLKPIV